MPDTVVVADEARHSGGYRKAVANEETGEHMGKPESVPGGGQCRVVRRKRGKRQKAVRSGGQRRLCARDHTFHGIPYRLREIVKGTEDMGFTVTKR